MLIHERFYFLLVVQVSAKNKSRKTGLILYTLINHKFTS